MPTAEQIVAWLGREHASEDCAVYVGTRQEPYWTHDGKEAYRPVPNLLSWFVWSYARKCHEPMSGTALRAAIGKDLLPDFFRSVARVTWFGD
jgi:hypothetical protein